MFILFVSLDELWSVKIAKHIITVLGFCFKDIFHLQY